MKKRILSLLLCLVMVVGLLPVTAQAANVNMHTYQGNRITQIVIKASVDTVKVSNPDDNYTESRNFKVGTPVVDVKFKFEVESLNYKTSTGGTGTMINNFPIGISVGPYYYDANNKKWGSVISYQMPNYLAGQYCYDVSAYVKDKNDLDSYRIDPYVKVTINWYGSGKTEDCTVNFWACNEDNRSLVMAKTVPFTITDNGSLELTPSLSIPSGYANEAIKSFSVASWASGGTRPYTFSRVSGPEGIEVDRNGTVYGAPTTACGTVQTLTVKVTDASGISVTTDITVGAVKAERTVINTIKIAGLSYPRVGDVVPKSPSVYVTEINDGAVSLVNSPIRLAMRFWKDDEGNHIYNALVDEPNEIHTFINGEEYVFNMQVRLEGEETCEKYRLAENLQVIVPSFTGGEAGHNTLTKTNQTNLIEEADYAYLSVSSPEWVPVNTGNTLTGTISYSGAARYGQKLTANVTLSGEAASEVDADDLSYQWQYKAENGIWYDVYDNGRSGSITLNDTLGVDELAGCDIRVTVRCTGTNYAGMLFGAPVTVGKNWNMGIPEKPVIEYNAANSKLTITDASWKSNAEMNPQEYAWTTSLTRDETTGYAVWPTSNQGTDKSLLPVTAGQTYYVYTRVKGSKTMEPGRIISAVAYTVPFADGSSSGGESGAPTSIWANDMVYPDYDSKTPTIYLKKGEQITVRYQLDPNNADANLPQWKETYNAADSTSASVTVNNDTDTKTLTITAGNKTGTVYVVAYRDANAEYPVNWYGNTPEGTTDGRQITVEIYDPEDPASVPFVKAYLGTTELYVNDTYEITKAALLDLPFVPADVEKNNYTLAAMFTNYGTGGSSGVITRSDTNDFVSLNNDTEKFVIKGEAETLSGSSVYVEFFALPGNEVAVEDYGRYAIAALSVTVKDRPAVPTRTATVSPNALSLLAGESYQLQAYMTPAETGDSFTWVSSDTNVATVDSTGKVTVAAGATASSTATITATCGEGDAAVSANCVITVKAGCGDNHTYEYLESGWGHVKVCIFCDKSDNVILDHRMSWLESTETAGKMYGECADCGYRTGLMDIPANETPADPTPDNPNNPDSPSTPNRPNLPNLPDSSSGGHHSSAGRPYRPDLSTAVPEGTTAAKPNSDVKSPGTGDAGIMLYAALSLMSMTGGAWLVSKKRRDR